MLPRFDDFIRERKYLHNVTPATEEWYRQSLRLLESESPTQAELNSAVVEMRARGRNASGCNCSIGAINAYLHWCTGSERKCGAACTHPRIRLLKEPQIVLPTFTTAQVKLLITWKPKLKNLYQRRLHLLALILLDTGARISEALALRVRDVDLDNLLATLDGKGRKQRLVPFSFTLRKAIFRFAKDFTKESDDLLLSTQAGAALSRDNMRRDIGLLCKKLGFAHPPRALHCFRHTFAVNYLRRGGGVFHLQKVLGHTSLEMTRRYANLVTVDLQAVHERVSLLSR